jgi:hypothetical protein
MTSTGGASASLGLLCLLIAAIMWWVADRYRPRVVVVLVLAGMTGIVGSGFARGLHHGAVYTDNAMGRFLGQYTGASIVGLVAILALAFVVIGLGKDKVTGKTIFAAMLVPVTVAMIPGTVGQVGVAATSALASAVGSVASALFVRH